MGFWRMAHQGVHLCCSICLDPLKNPVSIPCGHNFCSSCIEACWNQEDQNNTFSCPQCKERFTPRPVLKKNTMLSEVVDILKMTRLQAISPGQDQEEEVAGPGDVVCDSCTERKVKSVKTCLQCLVSYCDTHLQPHYLSPAFKNHKLVKASRKLQDNICSRHDEVKKVFCRTDQQCICYLCCMDKHKGHDTISAVAERTERQKVLSTSQQNIQQRIQEREKDVKLLHQQVESINHCADKAVEDSDTIFTDLMASIENKRSEVRKLIRDRQKHEVSRVEELTKVVEQEVTELVRRHAEMEQISNTTDHINFILSSSYNPSRINESTPLVNSNIRPLRYFEDVTLTVSKMADKLEKILKEEAINITETLNRVGVLSTLPIPKTRAEFLQYSCPITLDPNTSHQRLFLSNGNRKVTWMKQRQPYPHHPERFTQWSQVISREGLTGCCYWEVEWSGYIVDISVSYKINKTAGYDCVFGSNDTSWCLKCCNGVRGCVLRHGGIETTIPGPVTSRVGVYLDHSAGMLSFYSVSDTMTLLYRVQTTFTNTLYVGFGLYGGLLGTARFATAELCDIK